MYRCTHCITDPDAKPGDAMQLPFLCESRQTANQWNSYSKGLHKSTIASNACCRSKAQAIMYDVLSSGDWECSAQVKVQ
jgi:hypothetical protein